MTRTGNFFCMCLVLSAAGLWPANVPAETEETRPFREARPGYVYQFPRDHFSHDDFRIEWWYYTGNLKTKTQREFGYQLTFFRVALEGEEKILNPSKWKVDQVYFAHLTVSDIAGERFHFFERINRKGLGHAGAATDRLHVWNEDWVLTEEGGSHRMQALENGTGVDLVLTPLKDPVIHGEGGISRKGDDVGNASHYFSFTRMRTEGTVHVNGEAHAVEGISWMDREFSSNPMHPDLRGWDWYSLKLDNGMELMLYQLRRKDGSVDPHSSGTLVLKDGAKRHLELKEFEVEVLDHWKSDHTQITYPAGWRIRIQGEDAELRLRPDLADQELYQLRSISGAYWEGSVTMEGTFRGEPVRGKGYVELVGYGAALVQELPK